MLQMLEASTPLLQSRKTLDHIFSHLYIMYLNNQCAIRHPLRLPEVSAIDPIPENWCLEDHHGQDFVDGKNE